MIESVVASSLVELSTSGKQSVPLSLSRQPSTNNTPSGRVTSSKTKAPPPSTDSAPIVCIDLGLEDTTPPTAGKEPSIVQPLSTDRPMKKTVDKPLGAHSILPTVRGKTKLQFLVDRRMANLEERLQEYEILDHHLKEENVLLKERIAN